MGKILYLVIPCYNEEEVLRDTAGKLKTKINTMVESGLISDKSRIIFVNDGSMDLTWKIIEELHESDPVFGGVYKLVALQNAQGEYIPKIKISETVEKITNICYYYLYKLKEVICMITFLRSVIYLIQRILISILQLYQFHRLFL